MSPVYCALVHYPVRDRAGDTVTTAVTTLDVHDIARSGRTYGLRGYYVVTPIEAQHALTRRILEHWDSGAGRKRMPERHEALSICTSIALPMKMRRQSSADIGSASSLARKASQAGRGNTSRQRLGCLVTVSRSSATAFRMSR